MAYSKVNFKDYPDTTTPVSADNLNHMDSGILEANTKADEVANRVSTLEGTVSGFVKSHVGMIIMSTTLSTETEVKNIYGGAKWKKIEGRFLRGTDGSHAPQDVDGSDSVTLTTDNLPAHSHKIPFFSQEGIVGGVAVGFRAFAHEDRTQNTSTVGNGEPFDILPSYYTVYIWERTA